MCVLWGFLIISIYASHAMLAATWWVAALSGVLNAKSAFAVYATLIYYLSI
jgi:hypothetical protein